MCNYPKTKNLRHRNNLTTSFRPLEEGINVTKIILDSLVVNAGGDLEHEVHTSFQKDASRRNIKGGYIS